MDVNAPPLQWRRGRVIELYPTRDSVVRSVKLKTQSGELVRLVVKLCKLPVSDCLENTNIVSESNN